MALNLPQNSIRVDKTRFFHESHTTPGIWYDLNYNRVKKTWRCSCADSQFRPEKRGHCKHVLQLVDDIKLAIKRGGGNYGKTESNQGQRSQS